MQHMNHDLGNRFNDNYFKPTETLNDVPQAAKSGSS